MPALGSGDPDYVRFWRHVDKSEGCWLWTAAVVRGYGQFTSDQRLSSGRKRAVKAHRFAYAQVHGAIPGGLHVCHRCDVPLCVNPDHLFLGTNAENIHDRNGKGRAPNLKGERHPHRKLTDAAVRAIRGRHGEPSAVVAATFGVSPRLVRLVWAGQRWSHVR